MSDPASKNRVYIFDTTLRDGEQSPGCSMNTQEKLLMAQQLARLNVDIIEAGFAIASQGDFEAVREVARTVKGPRIMSLARTDFADIDRAAEAVKHSDRCGIHTFIATSDIHLKYKLRKTREEVITAAARAVERARSHVEWVEFSAEDSTRSDPEFMCKVLQAAVEAGATVLNIPDTVGYTMPHEYFDLITTIRKEVRGVDNCIISVHCHNDLGLAVANSLAAVRAGARQVECTVNGIGERAGNAAMEEVVMGLRVRHDIMPYETGIVTEQIYPSSRLLSTLTGTYVQPNKAVVGANAFAHEAGIHQDGVLKQKITYEIMTPESVGIPTNKLVLGKHSGRHAFRDRLEHLGFHLSDEEVQKAFTRFKNLADLKKVVYDEDIEAIVTGELIGADDRIRLKALNVSSGTELRPNATVTVEIEGQAQTAAAFGDGPVDAALNAIRQITGTTATVKSYVVQAITGGTDAQGDVSVTLEGDGKVVRGSGTDPDIVVASAKAYIQALNHLAVRSQRRIHAQG